MDTIQDAGRQRHFFTAELRLRDQNCRTLSSVGGVSRFNAAAISVIAIRRSTVPVRLLGV